MWQGHKEGACVKGPSGICFMRSGSAQQSTNFLRIQKAERCVHVIICRSMTMEMKSVEQCQFSLYCLERWQEDYWLHRASYVCFHIEGELSFGT